MSGVSSGTVATRPIRKHIVDLATTIGLILMILGQGGCSRSFWRKQADKDTYQAISEKVTDSRWAVPRYDLLPDPRSRFFDPYNPDASPMPPDDAAASVMMRSVDGWGGASGWDDFGHQLHLENPQWLANYGITPDMIDPESGAYSGDLPAFQDVTLDQAIELSLIHSREYQAQLEDLYLAALAVTFERYQFGVRYLGTGGREPSASIDTTTVPAGGTNSVAAGGRAGVSQLLPAGGQIAMELANNTLWLFNPGSTSTVSALSYSLVQPLLLGAGRKVVLERLTQSERNLLYALRDLARFRKVFFTNIVGSGTGYLSLLQQIQGIRNAQDNISRLERQVEELQAVSSNQVQKYRVPLESWPAGVPIPESIMGQLRFSLLDEELTWIGPLSDEQEAALSELATHPALGSSISQLIESIRVVPTGLDVLQLQSSLTNARNDLRAAQQRIQDTLDSFKLQLGLPPDLPLSIDDSMLSAFQFIDPQLKQLEQDLINFVAISSELNPENPEQEQLQKVLRALSNLSRRVQTEGVAGLDADFSKLGRVLPSRLAALESDADRERLQLEVAGDRRRLENVRSLYTANLAQIEELQLELEQPELNDNRRIAVAKDISKLWEDLLKVVRSLTVIQIGLRVEMVVVQPYERTLEESVAYAIENRLDLMNQRAAVVDSKRQVEIAANRLQAVMDVVVAGDLRTSGNNNPLDFRGDKSSLRAGLRFTAPIDQIAERNSYRAALIQYQQQRRAYMAAEDSVKQQVRNSWRQLEVLRRNLETSRQSARIAALQLDSAVAEATAPAGDNQGNAGGLGVRGRNLLSALGDVLRAQNDLVSNWVNYEKNRLNIHRDMDMMVIGPDGIWEETFYREGFGRSSSGGNDIDSQWSTRRAIDPNDEPLRIPEAPGFQPEPLPAPAGEANGGNPDDRGGADAGRRGNGRRLDPVTLVGFGDESGRDSAVVRLPDAATRSRDPRPFPGDGEYERPRRQLE
ncbi:MAG: TolC family protein [Planctomycetaceae bacterium]